MKIIDCKRGENQEVIAILEDNSEVTLSWEYVAEKKPQIGDDFAVEAKKKPAKEAAE